MLRLHIFLLFTVLLASIQADNDMTVSEALRFIKDVVRQHNIFRKEHNVPELKLNPDLVELAQEEAERLLRIDSLQTYPITYRGESLGRNSAFSKGSLNFSGEAVTKLWYEKSKNFNYNLNSFQNAGSFTQVVWKNSKEIGIGIARKGTSIYVVALYYPVGNIVNAITENVLPPIDRYNLLQKIDSLITLLTHDATKNTDISFGKKLSEILKSD